MIYCVNNGLYYHNNALDFLLHLRLLYMGVCLCMILELHHIYFGL